MPASLRPFASLPLPAPRLCLGITGHRESNAVFQANQAAIGAALASIFTLIEAAVGPRAASTRLHSLFAHGADFMALEQALQRGWEVAAPLPFGLALNIAINAHPESAADAEALLAGRAAASPVVEARATAMRGLAGRVRRFEMAEQDGTLAAMFAAMLAAPGDAVAAAAFSALASERVAAAGRVMIEQSDFVIAIWDGVTPGAVGGTRHTMAAALEQGAPVLWVDARAPSCWRILRSPEALFSPGPAQSEADVQALIAGFTSPPGGDADDRAARFHTEQWHAQSSRRFHAYRRVEAVFGGGRALASLRQTYEAPDAIASGSAAPLLASARALPGGDAGLIGRVEAEVLRRFAWADGLSTYLSDAYRGGMVMNFLLSAFAIIGGAAYLPLVAVEWKWPFALFELALLGSILLITGIGRKRRWHGRWFETRRVAEYLRHAPIMLLLGVARAPGRWPRGSETQWPEHHARLALRALGLPAMVVSQAYLRTALETLLLHYITGQQRYHTAKARRLTRVHHGLDHASERMFMLAVASVSLYLLLVAGGALGIVPAAFGASASKAFTFLGVALPALGGAFAGIRYFGDFERFAAISEVTAEKLEALEQRASLLLADPAIALSHGRIADLAHAMDDIVISEIESWQSVFAGKNIAVPV